MILSLQDILFQFAVLFSVGNLCLLLFLPPDHIGPKFFISQYWMIVGSLFLGCTVRFYELLMQGESIPLYVFLYTVLLFLVLALIYLTKKHSFKLAFFLLVLTNGLALISLYLHGVDLSRGRFSLEDITYFVQLFVSAFLLGAVFTAMMLCHWFFMFRKLPVKFLKRISHLLTTSLILKVFLIGVVIWVWKIYFPEDFTKLMSFDDKFMFLAVRFLIGLFFPLILAFGTEVTIKIPANHSAIGILYVAVIFIFMGEVLGQYLSLILSIPL